ncbi:MAG: hypothetical protein Q4C98_01885 [Capnocytophaga sp.]|nr:hypothetical protein [Capnocytophaga sp.]
MKNTILILLTLFSGNLFAQGVSETATAWFKTSWGVTTIIVFLALLVCYIIALQKTQKGEMIVFVNKYDFALMFSSYLFVVIAFFLGADPTYFWIFISLSAAAFITSLIWSVLANNENLQLGILAVLAKLFLMVVVLVILVLYILTRGVRQTRKTETINGKQVTRRLNVYEQMREDDAFERRKARALKLISFLLLSLVVGTVAYKNVLEKNDLDEENVNNLIAKIDMKKLLYVFLIAGIFTFSVGYSLGFPNFDLTEKISKVEQNDLQKEKLYGKVKSVETKTFTVKIRKGKIIKGEQALFEDNDNKYILFNEKGYILEKKYNSEGGFKYTYQYDSLGNKIEEYVENGQGKFYSKETYKYNGKTLQEEVANYENKDSKTIYMYDRRGLLSEEIHYDFQEKMTGKHMYKYDNQGRQTEHSVYDSKTDKTAVRNVYKYLDDGAKIEETYSINGDVLVEVEKFDKDENIIEYIEYNGDGSIYRKITYQYTFDDKRNITEVNEHLEYKNGTAQTSKYSYQYKYDNQGNYISKILFDDKQKPIFIYERKIEYYK